MAATVATSAAVVAVAAAAAAAAAAATTTSSSTTPNHFIPSPESLTDLDYMMVEEQCPNVSLPTSMFDFYYDHHHLISPTSTELIHHPLDLNSFDLLQSCFPSDMIHLNNMNPIFSAKDEEELIYLLNHNDNIHAQHHSSQNNINNQPLTKAPSCCASVTSSDISESTTIDSTYLLEQLLRQQENYMNICPVPSSPPLPLPPPSKSSDGPFDQQLLMLSSNTTDGNFITSITASPSSSK
ncbi:uncharacterized protein BX663DRAFT_34111 [Cokeromyces recurvatus]|uniref:uncharacterized protein n=1 Tax=Cokeromyces recurvatus TaxID=90255 RepID=UPI00221FB261|nr:uncharacterized protein BX663DRAFT_34111 [Cokeromyces recurvatus]KAI7903561.1 hypothetical protein BX663DRAFT_34111 [Cokeromyces recurvatus]